MRITDLLKQEGITINASVADKASVIDTMIALQPYNIRIFGASVLSKFMGEEFWIKVAVDSDRNLLRVGHISKA